MTRAGKKTDGAPRRQPGQETGKQSKKRLQIKQGRGSIGQLRFPCTYLRKRRKKYLFQKRVKQENKRAGRGNGERN